MTTTRHPEWVHRDLRLSRTPLKGADVRALQEAVGKRLSHRGEAHRAPKADGVYGPLTADAAGRALYLLGAGEKYVQAAHSEHAGLLDAYHQHMIRHPGQRNQRQIRSSVRRMREVHAHEKAQQAKDTHPAVQRVIAAAELALHNAASVHYTQGPARWQGIAEKLHASAGRYPNYADCSSFFTWCWWQVLGDGPDVLNGADWTGGFTGTLSTHGTRVSEPVAGAAVLYGPGYPYEHVALAISGGKVISHGSEAAPFLLPYNYRPDVGQFRVYH